LGTQEDGDHSSAKETKKEKTMKLTRLTLACTLLLLASTPVFALPECADCEGGECIVGPWSIEPCRYTATGCENYFGRCARLATAPALADWAVASVEIRRPEVTSDAVVIPVDTDDDCRAATITSEITAEK
jgi:hypothetical protein